MAQIYCPQAYASNSILYLPIQWRRTLAVRPLSWLRSRSRPR